MGDGDKICKTYKIVMVRNGPSEWNEKNCLCGWFDADLSELGYAQGVAAGRVLKAEGYQFDVAHTSALRRAQLTLKSILKELEPTEIPIPVNKTWRLNERHQGGLTGLNKSETRVKYGLPMVCIWFRSFDIRPPPMTPDHPFYETIVNDPRYAELPREEFPMCESLKQTVERTIKYWDEVIVPEIKEDKRVIIVGHGTSLRGIVQHVEGLTDEQVLQIKLPSGIPFVYELDEEMKAIGHMLFLGDDMMVKRILESGNAAQMAK